MKFRVSSHTDFIGAGSTYVVIKGREDGARFVPRAIEQGASIIVVQNDQPLSAELMQLCKKQSVTVETVENAHMALAQRSAQAYNYPAKKLTIVAVTGTDGKTTSSYLLYEILKRADKRVALLSGVQHIIGDTVIKADLTTAKADYLHYFFDQCVQHNVEWVVMEVCAQATTFHRIDGIEFAGCIFTNLAHEHGENYKTFEEYFAAKCAILAQRKSGAPLVVHAGSVWSDAVIQKFGSAITCGRAPEYDYQVLSLQETVHKQLLEVRINKQWLQLDTPLIGDYNASNIIGAIALMHQLGIRVQDILAGVHGFAGATGRLERYQLPKGSLAVIDYAHTPQAYTAVLARLRRYARRLYVIFGAGGGKDVEKRPIMGKIAAQYADVVLLTNDNPRHEDPQVIMDQISAHLEADELNRVLREPDRASAIKYACEHSSAGDIIAILGKGGEEVQIIGTQRLPHSDELVVRELMQG